MKYPPTAERCRISEIFSSLQGEGPHAGERHLFVRFEECHLRCGYCDELHKEGRWMTQEDVLSEIESLERESGPHRYVSLTGGEPLLYLVFLKPLLVRLKDRGMRTYLETNGVLDQALAEVADLCDAISMDMKLSSVTEESAFEEAHRRFLTIARLRKTHVKMVVSRQVDLEEFVRHVRILQETAPEVLLVLQPVSGTVEGREDPELLSRMEDLQRTALRLIPEVRILPRYQRILQIR